VGRTFAALKNYQVDGNKEMMAIGLMNVIGSATSCYVTTGPNIYSIRLSFLPCCQVPETYIRHAYIVFLTKL
jgi:hypothetical protein